MKTFLAPLSQAEEKEYLSELKNGSVQAKEKLILHNMRLVAHVAKKYLNSDEEQEDLISIGTIGLMKAVSTFDRDYGSRFATYAARCIEDEMLMYFRSRKRTKNEVSLYEPIGTDKEGNQIHLLDVVENEQRDIVEDVASRQLIEKIHKGMKQALTPREYMIICRRFGLYGQKETTQREIAKEIGISRSYVSRIEERALNKMKKVISE